MFIKTAQSLSKLALIAFIITPILSGCEDLLGKEEDEENGTLTVTVTGVVIESKYGVAGVFPAGADPDAVNPIAAGSAALDSTTITVTAKVVDGAGNLTSTIWEGSGGGSYDLYVLTKGDEPSNVAGVEPVAGDDVYTTFPITYKQDGNQAFTLSGANFEEY